MTDVRFLFPAPVPKLLSTDWDSLRTSVAWQIRHAQHPAVHASVLSTEEAHRNLSRH
jgi:hypothetical protein